MGSAAVRREKKKRQKLSRQATSSSVNKPPTSTQWSDDEESVVVVPDTTIYDSVGDPEMRKVLAHFAIKPDQSDAEATADSAENKEDEYYSPTGDDEYEQELSKKKRKQLERIPLAELKRASAHPEVVEVEDTTARFPLFLVQLKGSRNTIPVPKHWSRKRKYLAGKRGFVKPPFHLPPFIKDTGVCEQRETARAIDDGKSLKAKGRERMHPKLGKLAVNYERLHDAFFKYQTKPNLTAYGQLYFEGKEATSGGGGGGEGRKRGMRPGQLSEGLREALGMTSPLQPPPWLFAMQRFGPPPSYPHIRLPGLNAALPEGAVWGYHPGGWGRAPDGRFDTLDTAQVSLVSLRPVEKVLWGELEPEPDSVE